MKVLVLLLLPAVAFGQFLAGGITDTTVSATDEPVMFAVKASKEHVAQMLGSSYHELSLVNIEHARTQVVAGQKLYLDLHFTHNYYCNVTVWFRSWLTGDDRLILTDGPACTQMKASTRTGGISQPKVLPQSGVLVDALNFAACHLNDRINAMNSHRLGDTSAVTYTEQVTAGLTYRFYNVPMVSTGCQNNGCAGLDLANCPASIGGHGMTCNFSVQYQAWMQQKFSLIDLQC